jgi:predicted CopG family antitoxin
MERKSTPLTEKVLVSEETKQALMSIREPGERYGDVIERVLQDRKRHDFIAHLDAIAKEGEFVPLDSDPEIADRKKGMRREGKYRKAGAAVR